MNQLPENFTPICSPRTDDPFRLPVAGSKTLPCRRCGAGLQVSPRFQQIVEPPNDSHVLLCKPCVEAVCDETGNEGLKRTLQVVVDALRRGAGRVNAPNN